VAGLNFSRIQTAPEGNDSNDFLSIQMATS
jgi:hypothetical protein